MKFAGLVLLATLSFAPVGALTLLPTLAPNLTAQAETYDDLAKLFTDAVDAKRMKELPALSTKLAKTKDPRGILLMIASIDADNTHATIYGVGGFGLADITKVQYADEHDAGWWRSWWERSKAAYPADVQKMDFPTFKGFESKPNVKVPDADDVRGIPTKACYAEGDRNKLYILSGSLAKVPASGFKLLIVMAGGDGSIDFNPFIRRVQMNALGDDYLVAHMVATKWTSSQEIIWPTTGLKVDGMKFTTEEFIESVVRDVKKQVKLNPKDIFTLGWSSSGPAVYAHALSKDRSTTGAFSAMSVYNPSQLPTDPKIEGFPIFILHSPEDKTCPYWMAEKAKSDLTTKGAKVSFETYGGGHGWVEDPFTHIANGIHFLESAQP